MSEVTDKIRKLLAKAEGTDNANEAAIFLAKAQSLMAKHGLTKAHIDLSQIKERFVKSKFSVSKPKDYEMTLMTGISEAFGLELLWMGSFSHHMDNYADFIFIGPEDRLQLAVYAAEVLGRQIKRARTAYANDRAKHYYDLILEDFESEDDWDYIDAKAHVRPEITKQVTKEANSFAVGWATEVRKKVVKFAMNDREQQLIQQYKDNTIGKDEDGNPLQIKNQDTNLSYAAMMEGRKAAEDAHLHRPMGHDAGETNLLGSTKQLGHSS